MGQECCVIPAGKKNKLGREQASAMPMIFVTCVQSITIAKNAHKASLGGEGRKGA